MTEYSLLNPTSDEDLVKQAYRHIRQASDQTDDWRREFADLYELIAGRQWNAYDRSRRERSERPVVEFNLAQKFLDAVQGLQINNRQEIRFIPRKLGDVGVNELLTGAADTFRDNCDALTEESEAFLDCITGGLGVIETFIDFDTNEEGDIGVGRRDPLELFWDTQSRRRNLLDCRWVGRLRRMDSASLYERWPEKAEDVMSTSFQYDLLAEADYLPVTHDASEAWRYENQSTSNSSQFAPAAVLEYQYYRIEPMVKVVTPYGQKIVTPRVSSRLKEMLNRNRVPYRDSKLRTKKYYRNFMCGNVVLESGESPYQQGFTYQFITGRRDRNTNTWHGVGRHIRDPQRWVNAFFSEIIYIIQTNAKGGLIAEEDAFADPQQAESEWAEADSIVWAEAGAVSGGKFIPKPVAQYPQGLDKLMEFAVNAMPGTSGLNLEFMGMADRMQPGIVEGYRKQAAVSVLGWAFDSLRRYYLTHGKCIAYYIREFVSDGRLIRINGPEGQQYVKLVRDPDTYEYDVIVDEAPTSPNQRERTWTVIEQMMPLVAQLGLKPPLEILDYLPLPAGVIAAWKKMLAKPAEPPPPTPVEQAQIAEKQASAAKLTAEAKNVQTSAEIAMAKNQIEKAKIVAELTKTQHEGIKLQAEGQVRQADAFAKRARGTKDLVDAHAQHVETVAIKSGLLNRAKAGKNRSGPGAK